MPEHTPAEQAKRLAARNVLRMGSQNGKEMPPDLTEQNKDMGPTHAKIVFDDAILPPEIKKIPSGTDVVIKLTGSLDKSNPKKISLIVKSVEMESQQAAAEPKKETTPSTTQKV